MKVPEVTKKNLKKVLRELDISKYPSLPDYLKNLKLKVEQKKELSLDEVVLGKGKLNKFFREYTLLKNQFSLEQFDWSIFDHRPPKDFQVEGIKFLAKNDGAILADDQGLGKSIQSICATKVFDDNYKILIITLQSLKYNFATEINFYDNRISVINDKWELNKYVIIHYQQLKNFSNKIISSNFDIIIVDEAHKVKNSGTKRTEMFVNLINKSQGSIKKIWLLTGTPIDNRPSDFFNLLKIIKHPIAKDWQEYSKRYCDAYLDMFNRWNASGASNLIELHEKTKNSVLRRLKKNIKDLPNKYRRPVFYNFSHEDHLEYKKALKDFIERKYNWFDDDEKPTSNTLTPITKMMIWRQFCALKRITDGHTIELIENELDQGNKIIVFTNFTKVVDSVFNIIGKKECILLDGRIKPEDRLKTVDKFNSSKEIKVLVSNLIVGGTGFNIQSANTGIINDLALVPSIMLQAEDRMYRIGQNRDVNILYPLYKNTVDEALYDLISDKMEIITTVIDGKKENYFESNEYKQNVEVVNNITKDDLVEELFKKIDTMKITL